MQPSMPTPMQGSPQSYSQKHTSRNQIGALAGMAVLVLLLIAALIFGIWAFSSRQNFKNNSDKISAEAVKKAEAALSLKKEAEFAEAEKSPLRTYVSPKPYSAVSIAYPKTWSAYVDEKTGQSSQPVDAYFNPDFVPAISNNGLFAMRMMITENSYENELKTYASFIKLGTLKSVAFSPKLVPGSVGVRMDGALSATKQGSVVLLPVRDKTLKIWTENLTYINDFQATLDNLSFQP